MIMINILLVGDSMKRIFFIFSLMACVLSVSLLTKAEENNENIIIIDPGHGGMDSGCVYGDIEEEELNLCISYKLLDVFESNGYKVLLTRYDNNSLCEDRFIKKEDMNKRLEIINKSNALLCVSIHLNMFSDSKYRGAQVFYSNTITDNKILANYVQNSMRLVLGNTNRVEIKRDNIYILNRAIIPCVIVECGFLSNVLERNLLLSSDYQLMIAYSIYYGCIKYLYELA